MEFMEGTPRGITAEKSDYPATGYLPLFFIKHKIHPDECIDNPLVKTYAIGGLIWRITQNKKLELD